MLTFVNHSDATNTSRLTVKRHPNCTIIAKISLARVKVASCYCSFCLLFFGSHIDCAAQPSSPFRNMLRGILFNSFVILCGESFQSIRTLSRAMFSVVGANFPFIEQPSHVGSPHIHAFDLDDVLVICRESFLHLIALPQRALYVIGAMNRLESCSLSCNHFSLVLGELAVLLLCLSPARINLWLEELLSCVPCLSSVHILIMKVYDNLTTNFVRGTLN